jgi:hypothetical protein
MRELKPDLGRLTALQRRLGAMRDQARGLMAAIGAAERQRDLVAARLAHVRRRQEQFERARGVPSGSIHYEIEAQAVADTFNTPPIAVQEHEAEIAALDAEIASKRLAHAELMLRVHPLGELTLRCERWAGQPGATLLGVVTNAVPDGAREFLGGGR